MDLEFVVEDLGPHIAAALGMPLEVAQRALRHVMSCPEEGCVVQAELESRLLPLAAEACGTTAERVRELAETTAKAANDTAVILERDGSLSRDQAREIYRNATGALGAGLEMFRDQAE